MSRTRVAPKVGKHDACCRCCEAAQERGELDHVVGEGPCPYPACNWCC